MENAIHSNEKNDSNNREIVELRQADATHTLFLQWLLLLGTMLFVGWLFWDQGLLQAALLSDPTHITLIILLLFTTATAHCAARTLFLSRQRDALDRIIEFVSSNPAIPGSNISWVENRLPATESLAGQMFIGLASNKEAGDKQSDKEGQLLAQVMAEQARGQHEIGWFICGLLVKLGLLGTVVGFVLMLAPVAELESFDQSDIQGLLQRMTTGMGVALNTTLMGLSCSMLLGIQYLMLDRAADRLVAKAVQFSETRLFKAAHMDA